MAKIDQTTDDLNRHLRDSIGFLNGSCAAFDAGLHGEAKRLATTIRLLLHDTKHSKSLLGQLGIKSSMKYITTATTYNPMNLLGHHGLVGFRMGGGSASYSAPLGNGPPSRNAKASCDFDAWWNEVVIVDVGRGTFSRGELVLSVADTDGGAHVDPQLDAKYWAMTRDNSLGYEASIGEKVLPLTDVELHSVRQIAFELLRSLTNQGLSAAC